MAPQEVLVVGKTHSGGAARRCRIIARRVFMFLAQACWQVAAVLPVRFDEQRTAYTGSTQAVHSGSTLCLQVAPWDVAAFRRLTT